MKTPLSLRCYRSLVLVFLTLAFAALSFLSAKAGLTFSLQISRGYGYYYCYPSFYTNSTPPAASQGGYLISSPTNAWKWSYQLTGAGMSYASYINSTSYANFDAFLNQLTNGNWTILFTNAVTTNLYTFNVSVTGFDSNSLPNVTVTYPMNGAVNIPNNPTFTWDGPTSWGGNVFVEDYDPSFTFSVYAYPLASDASWTFTTPLTNGDNEFYISYSKDASAMIVASQPLDGSSQPIAGWSSGAALSLYAYSDFTVTSSSGGGGSGGHTLVAHYPFNDGFLDANDTSGNGNSINSYFSSGGASLTVTNDAREGADAIAFDNNAGAGSAYYYTSDSNLVSPFTGSFSVSLWLKTTQFSGSDTDSGLYGNAGIVSTFYQTVVPMVLTGSKLAFVTDSSSQDTLHSATAVNTGGYVHVVVTRDQDTGEKKIYVNGALDASDVAETGVLSDPNELEIGQNNGTGYNGEMDDLQIYSGVLSASDVSNLYNNPGTTIADTTGGSTNTSPFTFITNGAAITITGYTGAGGAVTIPDTINGYPVTTIGSSAFFNQTSLTSVQLGVNITSVGDFAFNECYNLSSVVFFGSVTNIGTDAFAFCFGLTSLTIPSSVTSIGYRAFGSCINLPAISVDAANPNYSSLDGVLFDKSQATLIQFPAGKGGNYTIPGSVASIGDVAFDQCIHLISVTIPGSVTSIGPNAFEVCSGLTNVVIPNSVISLGSGAFRECSSLAGVNIPTNISFIQSFTFENCGNLTNIIVPASVSTLDASAFNGCANLAGLYFQGNAPFAFTPGFVGATNAVAYYLYGTAGWSSTFAGIPAVLLNPPVPTGSPNFGVQNNQFGFDISGHAGQVIVVEATTNLFPPLWLPIWTNTITNGSAYFSDPQWTNYPGRYYRAMFR
jgi:hypothetical protein